jgi:hypothetical protein
MSLTGSADVLRTAKARQQLGSTAVCRNVCPIVFQGPEIYDILDEKQTGKVVLHRAFAQAGVEPMQRLLLVFRKADVFVQKTLLQQFKAEFSRVKIQFFHLTSIGNTTRTLFSSFLALMTMFHGPAMIRSMTARYSLPLSGAGMV